jgi:serine/threonine protein kinase
VSSELSAAIPLLNLGLHLRKLTVSTVDDAEADRIARIADGADLAQQKNEVLLQSQRDLEENYTDADVVSQHMKIIDARLSDALTASMEDSVDDVVEKDVGDGSGHRHLKIAYDDIVLEKLLKKGSFAEVHVARFNHQKVAVKLLNDSLTPEETKLFISEVQIFSQLRSERLVQLYGFCAESGLACIVMPFMEGGSLSHFLRGGGNSSGNELSFFDKFHLSMDVALGVHFLHAHGVVHCNLRVDNVMVDVHRRAKLSEFGRNKAGVDDVLTRTSGDVSELARIVWSAPEQLESKPLVTFKTDVFKLGTIMWAILTARTPHADLDSDIDKVCARVLDGSPHDWTADGSDASAHLCDGAGAADGEGNAYRLWEDLVTLCVRVSPRHRPTSSDVVAALWQVYTQCSAHAEPSLEPPLRDFAYGHASDMYRHTDVCGDEYFDTAVALKASKQYFEAFPKLQLAAALGVAAAYTQLGSIDMRGLHVEPAAVVSRRRSRYSSPGGGGDGSESDSDGGRRSLTESPRKHANGDKKLAFWYFHTGSLLGSN